MEYIGYIYGVVKLKVKDENGRNKSRKFFGLFKQVSKVSVIPVHLDVWHDTAEKWLSKNGYLSDVFVENKLLEVANDSVVDEIKIPLSKIECI